MVVYRSSRFMVWVNGKQNSGLVKFVSESRFPWIGIRHLANNNGCEGLKTGIKDGSEEMENELPFGISRPEKQDFLFR